MRVGTTSKKCIGIAGFLALAACQPENEDRPGQNTAGTLGGISSMTGDTDGSGGGGDTEGDTDGFGGGSDESGETGVGDDGPKFDLGDGDSDTSEPPPSGDEECAAVSEDAEFVKAPADIIFVVDNSGSMSFEAGQIQQRLNDFSAQIIASGVDVHVILVSSYPGQGHGICIDPPLGAGGCPNADSNPPLFNHVNQVVGSHNSWDQLLATHGQWAGGIRPDSSKHVVIVSDDDTNMSQAQFDAAFKALDPTYADYIHHSVVCHSNCASAADIGTPYINLSAQTGGVAADLCDQDFQAVFDVLSTEVISGTQLACEFDIPEPPNGEAFDADKVNVDLDDGFGNVTSIPRVDGPAFCAGVVDGWYYDNPAAPVQIIMCPQTCEKAQLAMNGSVSIAFGCETVVPG
ncbi:MAG: hypothetical protein AAGA54_16005 [Myxococcota bacterium]